MHYRDMLLDEMFSEEEMKVILGIANGIVRWCGQEQERMGETRITDSFMALHHGDLKGKSALTQWVIWAMDAQSWIAPKHFEYLPYAMWEAYWLLRGTTAYDISVELGYSKTA